MDKTRILILVNHEIAVYKFRKEIVEELLRKNYEVVISSSPGKYIDELIELGCQFEPIYFDRHGVNPFSEIKIIKHYKDLMKRVKPDTVLTFTIKPNIYGAIAAHKFDIPVIANITGLGTAVENDGILGKITSFLYKYSFRNVNTIFFQNTENLAFFNNLNITGPKMKLLPGSGVNLNQFKLMEYPKDDTIEFVFIARIMKEKGIDQYLEAAKYIKNKYPYTAFHICGFCEQDYEKILVEYEKKGIVKYHGMVTDIRTILKGVHCTIHPTYYPEGMSNVLLESSAVGRALITTNRSGTREILDEGVNGYFVEEKNTEDLIEKIERFINLDYESKVNMGLASRRKIEKDFDREIVVSEYLKVISEINSNSISGNKIKKEKIR